VVLPGHNEVVCADVHRFSVSVASIIIEFRSVLSIAVDSGIVTIIWCSDGGIWTETDVSEDRINSTSSWSKSRFEVLESNGLTSILDTVVYFVGVVKSVGSITNTNQSNFDTEFGVVRNFFARLLVTSWFTIGEDDSPLVPVWVDDISVCRIMSPHRQTFLHSSLDER